MSSKFLLAGLLALMLSACMTQPTVTDAPPAAPEVNHRAELVGTWYEESTTAEGERRMQIVQRLANGTFNIRFRFLKPSGEVWEQTEAGFWGSSGAIYFTIVRGFIVGKNFSPTDPTNAAGNHVYQIVEMKDDHLRYRSPQSAKDYVTMRVADAFEFPG